MTYAPLVVLAVVFVLIAVRRIGSVRLQIWQIMLGGAVAVFALGQIPPKVAIDAVNLDVMAFLFGMFVIGEALEESGYLARLSRALFRRARSVDGLVLLVLFGMGGASTLLMNDTLAIVGTPLVLLVARRHGMPGKLMLLALAFAVTIGSVTSPIGNPQNLLIAVDGNVRNPFVTFFAFLLVPTVINLLLAYLVLKLFFREHFHELVPPAEGLPADEEAAVADPRLALVCRASLVVLSGLVAAKVALVFLDPRVDFRLSWIALASALPILVFSPRRLGIVRRIDWPTLVFFAAMFVLMESVWRSGIFQMVLDRMDVNVLSIAMILLVSVVISQFISNVPLVALYLPMLLHQGASTREMVALAAGSTIAGNLFILGAASNVIIIQNAEARTGETLTFLEFAKVGVPLTILNTAVYWLFLAAGGR